MRSRIPWINLYVFITLEYIIHQSLQEWTNFSANTNAPRVSRFRFTFESFYDKMKWNLGWNIFNLREKLRWMRFIFFTEILQRWSYQLCRSSRIRLFENSVNDCNPYMKDEWNNDDLHKEIDWPQKKYDFFGFHRISYVRNESLTPMNDWWINFYSFIDFSCSLLCWFELSIHKSGTEYFTLLCKYIFLSKAKWKSIINSMK